MDTKPSRKPASKTDWPREIRRLLATTTADFLPGMAIGAFAGLRSAEIERLTWQDVHLAEGHIVVGKDKAKTASRRVVPLAANLASWLTPHAAWTGNETISAGSAGAHLSFFRLFGLSRS